ncbi:MAG: nucleotidyltransferase family protein [Gammaproteobacteria bacterium]
MKKSIAISTEESKIISQILSQHLPAEAVIWVFGSRAAGNPKPFSDLDLLLDAGSPLSAEIMTAIVSDFEDSDLPYQSRHCRSNNLTNHLDWETELAIFGYQPVQYLMLEERITKIITGSILFTTRVLAEWI